MILALALEPFKRRFILNKKEGAPMAKEPDEPKPKTKAEAKSADHILEKLSRLPVPSE